MQNLAEDSMELLVCVTNPNQGDHIIKLANEKGIQGGTVFYGEGTSGKGLLKVLGLDSIRREIVLMITSRRKAKEALHHIAETKSLKKKNKGIGFRFSLNQVLGIHEDLEHNQQEIEEEYKLMHQAIFVIVNKGEAEDVMEYAQDAGAQGGTIIQARGAGNAEARTVFNMDIVPEKEIIMIISEKAHSQEIIDRISHELKIEEPNKGILFVTDLNETLGLQ
ncbi:P-II family nitrogen regulator [Marinilactibacillus psychrotolerans]|uniref:P-II family nitrogen regulator n=1 Tax=Marinilactibacillus psychrotolerans TaxID=191770 RepID=UPI00388A79CA